MPWQECYKMDERLLFVARLPDGEKMAALCREFDVSRKTGYKIFQRYKDCGLDELTDHSRHPYPRSNRLPFVREFNHERPHEALAMTPAEAYSASATTYRGLPNLTYPLHDRDVLVTACGRICMHRKRINISTVLAGQRVGIKEVDEGIWIVSFMQYDLGYIDLEQKTLQPLDNPFGARLSPMS